MAPQVLPMMIGHGPVMVLAILIYQMTLLAKTGQRIFFLCRQQGRVSDQIFNGSESSLIPIIQDSWNLSILRPESSTLMVSTLKSACICYPSTGVDSFTLRR